MTSENVCPECGGRLYTNGASGMMGMNGSSDPNAERVGLKSFSNTKVVGYCRECFVEVTTVQVVRKYRNDVYVTDMNQVNMRREDGSYILVKDPELARDSYSKITERL